MSKKGRSTDKRRFEKEAFADYMAGLLPNEIAKKHGVKLNTIRGWIRKGEWTKRRREAIAGAQESVFNRFQQSICESTENLLRFSVKGTMILALVMDNVHDDVYAADAIPRCQLMEKIKDIEKLATVAEKMAKIQAAALPHASEELSKLIYEELKRLGRTGILSGDVHQ